MFWKVITFSEIQKGNSFRKRKEVQREEEEEAL
jgi:hypothetical protein